MKRNLGLDKVKFILAILIIAFLSFQTILAQNQNNGTQQLIVPQGDRQAEAGELVELNFKNIEIRSLLDIISQATGKSFLFHERDLANRRITLISSEKYTIEEAYEIFERILSVNDLKLIAEDNNIIRVVNVNVAKSSLTDVSRETGDDTVVTRIIKVKNTNINTLFRGVNPFLSKTGIITIYTPTNSFIVKDSLENAERIAKLVDLLDQDTDYSVKRYTLKNISVDQFKLVVDRVISKQTTTGESNFFSYDKVNNVVIAIARQNETKKLEQLIKQLDVNTADEGSFSLEVIPVQYLPVANVLGFLQKVFKTGVSVGKSGNLNIGNSTVIPLTDANSFIIYGPSDIIDRVKFYVAEVDQESSNIVLEVVQLLHSDVNTASRLVSQIFQTRIVSGSPLKLKTFIEAGSNSLILLGTDKTIEKVKQFLAKFDKPRTAADSQGFKFYFYPVQNASASNIASILSSISSNIVKQATITQTSTTTTPSSTASAKQDPKKPATPAPTPAPTPAKQTAAASKEQLSIIADTETNSLIIYANQAQYSIIKNAIEDLDVVRPQVFVEALIVEIGVENNLNLGVNYNRAGFVDGDNPAAGVFGVTTPGGVNTRPVPQTIGPANGRPGLLGGTAGTGALLGVIGNTISYNGH